MCSAGAYNSCDNHIISFVTFRSKKFMHDMRVPDYSACGLFSYNLLVRDLSILEKRYARGVWLVQSALLILMRFVLIELLRRLIKKVLLGCLKLAIYIQNHLKRKHTMLDVGKVFD